ncbi:UNVERIFIED_CONTAM: hypothetical protein Sangu_3262400 [Sesamum angustifolium]|uniref:Retrotransposon Copia-like N-terminal domain-containing protein n=1 Tax=Sesamum angustifolium TaxID=2727405 RepID=A0AAW2JB25_9LAMI
MATELVEKTPARDTTDDSLLEKDVLFLHPSDHPGMALSSMPMDGTNFLPWTRAVWRRVDLMITSWIWNSISKEIVKSFMYTKTARDLWLDLHARYGQSNGPMIYEIRRGIASISQGTLSLTGYFSRFKELWDEIVWLEPPPKCLCGGCSCDISKVISERMEAHQVMQFLMGLHDSFDAERSQILMLDPLPNVQKVYAMILRIEKQRAVQVNVADTSTNTAYQVALTARKDVAQKKRGYVDKRSLICDNCHKPGHSKDSCFKLYGVPEWYKSLSDQKKKGTGGKALMANVTKTVDASPSEQNIGDLVTELLKIVKSTNTPSDPVTTTYANYVHIDEEFAGNASNHSSIDFGYWIIDTGATNHICADITMFTSYAKPSHKHSVHLPDGTKKPVLYVGTVKLSDNFVLDNVLHIPGFSVNLLSVSQLAKSNSVSLTFTQTGCILQDQASRKTLALGTLYEKLYVLNRASFNVYILLVLLLCLVLCLIVLMLYGIDALAMPL